jgi:hypothetical protein
MNPNYSEMDQYLRTMGQVEPEPETEPNEPEKPSGGEQVTDNEDPCLIFSTKTITLILSKNFNL